jgi:hypothetical protein
VVSILIFAVTDLIYKPVRVNNLLLFNSQGFSLEIAELRSEGGLRTFYNKATVGLRDVVFQHISYFSPEFLVINGDLNTRFGFSKMSPINLVEYLFVFTGLYYLFKIKEKWRWFLIFLLLSVPIAGSLSWAESSLTRTLLIFIPLTLISSYGIWNLLKANEKWQKHLLLFIGFAWIFFSFYSWDFYLNHYPKRGDVLRHWQAGYRELGSYISNNYDRFNNLYISKKNGQPYIFTLFYSKYSPSKYQKEANLSQPDQYGFGQVEKYDKFVFSFVNPIEAKESSSIIGYPDDFNDTGIGEKDVKKITVGGQEIFWIYEKL